jgi:hypothetical protein
MEVIDDFCFINWEFFVGIAMSQTEMFRVTDLVSPAR